MRRPTLALLVAPLVFAACSTEEASPAATGPTATLPPVTTGGEATTTAPESTVPPVDDTTTTSPATTTAPPDTPAPPTPAPPAGVPVAASIPLLLGGGAGGGWLYLGSWETTAWQSAFSADDSPIEPAVPAGSTVVITGLEAGANSGLTGTNVESCFDERVGPTIDATVGTPMPPGFGYSAVALPATWPVQPRTVAVVDASVPAYESAGQAVFAADPVDVTLGAVEQIVLADLDGDGDEEALVAFEHVDPAGIIGTPGDFAALLLIDTATGTATTLVSTFVGPLEENDFPIIDRFRVLDVADLNGDGRMEVVVHSWYYEGAAALAYEYDGTSLTEVLATGCGA